MELEAQLSWSAARWKLAVGHHPIRCACLRLQAAVGATGAALVATRRHNCLTSLFARLTSSAARALDGHGCWTGGASRRPFPPVQQRPISAPLGTLCHRRTNHRAWGHVFKEMQERVEPLLIRYGVAAYFNGVSIVAIHGLDWIGLD